MKHSVRLLLFVLAVAPATARDTLAFYDHSTANTFYRDRSIVAQAARFDLGAPAYVRRLTIWLAGKATGTAIVTLYGNEGAFAAPLLGQPLSNSITIRKDRPGVQKVEVVLPPNVFIDRPQFFVTVSDLSEGIVWLSDRREKRPRCVTETDRWLYQAIKGADGVWRAGKYGYAIEAIVDYPQEIPPTYLADITIDAGFPDDLIPSFGGVVPTRRERGGSQADPSSIRQVRAQNFAPLIRHSSIAWADIDNDTRPDVLAGNRLFINKDDDRFEEATDRLGTTEHARAHHFIDIENDGDSDILLIGLPDSTSLLLENDGDGYFRRRELDLPPITNPTTVSFADADRNGYLDVFIGQGTDDTGATLPSYLLKNNGGTLFVPLVGGPTTYDRQGVPSSPSQGDRPDAVGTRGSPVISSQWLDFDSDGDPDLYLTGNTVADSRLLINDGAGNLSSADPLRDDDLYATTPSGTSVPLLGGQSRLQSGQGVSAPSDWADANADGVPDLLQPVTYNAAELIASDPSSPFVEGGPSRLQSGRGGLLATLPYQGFNGGATWADADNDGRLDALVTSACDCRFASLYVQDPSGHFQDQSFEFGLFRLPAGADAAWVDFNADGKLDVATFVGGQFRLLKNTGDFQANYIEADLSGSSESSAAVGGTVTVYYGDKKQTRPIMSGRGALMQGPLRVHFGLGDVPSVDSMVVEWNGEERHTLVSPALNKIHYPFSTERSADNASPEIAFTVWPNPFRTALNFRYTVPEKTGVRLEIHRVDGELLSVIVDEEQAAGDHSAEWQALDANGSPLPAGTYIYRVRIGTQMITGRAVLTK